MRPAPPSYTRSTASRWSLAGPLPIALVSVLAAGCNAILDIESPVLDPTLDDPDGEPDGRPPDSSSPACTPGESECDDGAARTCQANGAWGERATCKAGCAGDGCKGLCEPGTYDCEPVPQRCAADGQSWVELASCDARCAEECGCEAGDAFCNGNTLLTCTASGELEGEVCPFSCLNSNGSARCGCEPGQGRCDDKVLLRCNAEGEWIEDMACPDGCTEEACTGCEAGARECVDGSRVRTCADGVWQPAAPCTNTACVASGRDAAECPAACMGNGECTGECVPRTNRCAQDENAIEMCDEAGAWQIALQCDGPRQICDGGTCAPNEPYLLGNDDVRDGDWEEEEMPPGYVLAIPVSVPRDATLLGLRVRAAAGDNPDSGIEMGRMALYDSTPEGEPGIRIAVTEEFAIIEGRTGEAADAPLLGGETYWVAAVFSGAAPLYRNDNVDSEVYAYEAPAGDLPEEFPLGIAGSVVGQTYSLSMLVQDATP